MRIFFKDPSGSDIPEMKEKWMDHPPSTGDIVLFGSIAYKIVRREWQIRHPLTECTVIVVPDDTLLFKKEISDRLADMSDSSG